MKTRFLLFLILLASSQAFSQKSYQKGYFINQNKERTECLIKNEHWLNTPQHFFYKLGNDSTTHKGTLKEVSSFQIYDVALYQRYYLHFENETSDIALGENYGWTLDTLFLQVEVDGNPSLLYYENGSIKQFFYLTPADSVPVALKRGAYRDNGHILYRSTYKNQLNLLGKDCKNIFKDSLAKLKYDATALGAVILDINKCRQPAPPDYVDYRKKTHEKALHFGITLTPGLNFSNTKLVQHVNAFNGLFNTNFGYKPNVNMGLEIDLHSGIYLSRLHFLIAPSFQTYSGEKIVDEYYTTSIKLKHLDVALGIRYDLLQKDKLNLFADAFWIPVSKQFKSQALVYGRYMSSGTTYNLYELSNISSGNSFAIGGGVQYGRFGMAARYYLQKDISNEALFGTKAWEIPYSRFGMLLRVKLF